MKKVVTKNLKEFKKVAEDFILKIRPNKNGSTVLALVGDLGAGKTTFSKTVGKTLGVKTNMTSPTFTLIKNYKLKNQRFDNLVHIDAYRLKSEKEIITLGWKEILKNKGNLVIVEWPENIKKVMPEITIKLEIKHIVGGGSKDEREIIML